MKPPPQKPNPADQWRPHTTPGFEVNGNGQLRTAGHKPQEARHPIKKPEPAVTEGHVWDWADYGC